MTSRAASTGLSDAQSLRITTDAATDPEVPVEITGDAAETGAALSSLGTVSLLGVLASAVAVAVAVALAQPALVERFLALRETLKTLF